jgi:hypothetical protein
MMRKKIFFGTMDSNHLSVEGSKYMAPHFDSWLRQVFGFED